MRLFRWEDGRQRTGYRKLKLLEVTWPIKMDMYVLNFAKGVGVVPHTDKVPTGRHYRMNITLVKPKFGGVFFCRNKIVSLGRLVVFRPDVEEHYLTPPATGPLYMLSIGWVRDDDGAKR